jgi:hypothetical protein
MRDGLATTLVEIVEDFSLDIVIKEETIRKGLAAWNV